MIRIVKRLLLMIVVIWLAASVNFLLPRLTDRDPIEERLAQALGESGGSAIGIEAMVEQYQAKFGTDRPLWRQYLSMLGDTARFDLGVSINYFPDRVADHVLTALPWSIALLGTATLISFAVGTVLGALTIWRQSSAWLARVVPLFMVLAAIPFYLVGLILVYVFALLLGWFPPARGYSVGLDLQWSLQSIGDVLYHAILPAASIVLAAIGIWALSMRGMMVTVQGEDYMNFARAKGLSDRRRFWRYAVRNAITPQVTTLVLAFGNIVAGAILVERVFVYPGIGTLLFNAILLVDYFLIFGCVFILILTVAVSLMLLDLLYPLLDPRIDSSADSVG
jgi:peptide/nickel transport system permease protein